MLPQAVLKVDNKNLADQLMASVLLGKTDMLLGLSTDLIMPLKFLIGMVLLACLDLAGR